MGAPRSTCSRTRRARTARYRHAPWWRPRPTRACELLALTDHDTVDGVDEAMQAGAARGLRVVPAVELSALDDDREDLHILGYLIDHHAAGLLEALAEFRADRGAAPSAWPRRCAPAAVHSTCRSAPRSAVPISLRLRSIIPPTGCASSARRS